jgi:branched-chain amino acid transport system substrate-binding protein
VFIDSGAATSDLTGKACTPNTVHWTYDTWSLANGTGKAVVKAGAGHLVLPHCGLRVRQGAGEGHPRRGRGQRGEGARLGAPPLNASDFSSFLLQAQASEGERSSASPTPAATRSTPIKAAAEFGIVQGGQKLAGLLVFISDVHALGLKGANGLQLTVRLLLGPRRQDPRLVQEVRPPANNEGCPAWSRQGSTPGVLHYLKAVQA